MTDIFTVTKGTNSSFRIQGVFSTRDQAQNFITHSNMYHNNDAKIETWELDSTEYQRTKPVFRVEYIPEFDNWRVAETDIATDESHLEYVHKGQDEDGYSEEYVYKTYVNSRSEESALRLGMERIVQFISRETADIGVQVCQ